MKNKNRYIAIMAGGLGTRFWPSSTPQRPKQFLDILGIGQSLLQMTFDRATHLVDLANILVVTHSDYLDLVQQHLPDLPLENILCEPTRNNTAPSVAYVTCHIQALNPQASVAVLSSDHVITKEIAFIQSIEKAFGHCEDNDSIVTLSIQPTRPDTGYGYVEVDGAHHSDQKIVQVKSFREKPDAVTAASYLDSGAYFWNAGMFIFRVATMLEAFEKYEPSILVVLYQDKSQFGSAQEQDYINTVYGDTKSISVDYAIIERAKNIYTIGVDIGWTDLGTWQSLFDFSTKNEASNVIQSPNAYMQNVSNCYVKADKTVIIRDLEDYIVVDEEHALLIYPKKHEQDIKAAIKNI